MKYIKSFNESFKLYSKEQLSKKIYEFSEKIV
jgi:hypothetical protein